MTLAPRIGSGALGGAFVHLGSIGSTNDRARELAKAGATHGTLVVAEQQSEGRGRQGRTWIAAPGSALTLSVLLRIDANALRSLPLAAAVAVCEACEAVAPVEAKIKWPNDVWLERRKVAGILIEARPQEGWAVLGIGVNVNLAEGDFPEDLRETATSLSVASGQFAERELVLTALIERLATRLEESAQTVLDLYRDRDALRDQQISWSGGSGTAQGVDELGNLVVFTDGGERLTLDAGEVHLNRID